jgi:hypothetical protein
MHWFDRMSKQFAAVPTETTRRGVLSGAAVAAVVAPFAPGALAYANRRLKAQTGNEKCLNCLTQAARKSQNASFVCNGENPFVPRLEPKGGGGKGGGAKGGKGGGKGRKGAKPSEAAKRAACLSKAAKTFLQETTHCVRVACASPGENAPVPAPGRPEGSTCATGTTHCTGTLCCYGTDQCCPCSTVDGGSICCVAVIQCTCCG